MQYRLGWGVKIYQEGTTDVAVGAGDGEERGRVDGVRSVRCTNTDGETDGGFTINTAKDDPADTTLVEGGGSLRADDGGTEVQIIGADNILPLGGGGLQVSGELLLIVVNLGDTDITR